MSATLIVQILEALAEFASAAAPLIARSETALSETDAAAVHAALVKAEQATATLRPQVDAVLAEAARK